MEQRPPWAGLSVDALVEFAVAAQTRGHRLGTTADLTAAAEVYEHLDRTRALSADPARAALVAKVLVEVHIELGKLTGNTGSLDTAIALAGPRLPPSRGGRCCSRRCWSAKPPTSTPCGGTGGRTSRPASRSPATNSPPCSASRRPNPARRRAPPRR